MLQPIVFCGSAKSADDFEAYDFEAYYAGSHWRSHRKCTACAKWNWPLVGTRDGSALPFYRTAELFFNDLEKRILGVETAGELKNFAAGGAVLFIPEVQ